MSQITRCPSCATAFKVVADQLRISEGWVRCGQCKEVFDAAAHLLPAAPPALLPEVALASAPAPAAAAAAAARRSVPERAWGASAAPPGGATGLAARQPSPLARPAPSAPAAPLAEPALPDLAGAPELAVPPPSVPAFLAVDAAQEASPAAPPFPWRAGGAVAPGIRPAIPSSANPVPAPGTSAAPVPPELPALAGADAPAMAAGYELPSAAVPDSVWPDDEVPLPQDAAPVVETLAGYAPLELPTKKPAAVPAAEPEPEGGPVAPERAEPSSTEPADEALALVEDDSPAAVLQPPRRARAPGVQDDDEEDAEETPPSVGFVIAAQRKAFWRKPGVRLLLGLLGLLALSALALQVAVHERDRLAAMDARARPWLVKLCTHLQCTVAAPRQIADVVIDSSSFNKARGDSYLLAFSVKSKAAIPLAMPAVELTLTDAQDQPVVRRVLLPADMGAPAELAPQGDWGASVSVVVTTAGARVTGYRLLAFYP